MGLHHRAGLKIIKKGTIGCLIIMISIGSCEHFSEGRRAHGLVGILPLFEDKS
jgi:hypothetical protein